METRILTIDAVPALQKEVYETAVAHGWYEKGLPHFGERISLIHSELSEAVEEYRANHPFGTIRYEGPTQKPEGAVVEIADVAIRVLDVSEAYKIDLAAAMRTTADETVLGADGQNFGDRIAAIHYLVGDAYSAFFTYGNGAIADSYCGGTEGVPAALARVIHACNLLCVDFGGDLVAAIDTKKKYNNSRPYRHGGKKI